MGKPVEVQKMGKNYQSPMDYRQSQWFGSVMIKTR